MKRYSILPLLFAILLPGTLCSAEYKPDEDEKTLKAGGIGTETKALQEYFEKRLIPENDLSKALELIKKLSDDDFDVREQTTEALKAMGPAVAPLLRQQINNSDREVVRRARECLSFVEKSSAPALKGAAIRLLAHRDPESATDILLRFEPLIDDESVLEAYRTAFQQLAQINGKPNPGMLKAVESKRPQARALAREALARTKSVDVKTAKGYLQDESPLVKLRVALALVEQEEKEMIPFLIGLLPDLTIEQAWDAESILLSLAGSDSPRISMNEARSSREKARDAWKGWWENHGATVKLSDLKDNARYLGLTLVAMQDNRGIGQIFEMDRLGRKRWSINNLAYPLDGEILPNGNVLVAEMSASRVSERHPRTGKIVWQHQMGSPLSCQRLKNGHIFMAAYRQLLEVDKQGKVHFSFNYRQGGSIRSARKLPNGEIVLLTSQNQITVLNARGAKIRNFRVGLASTYCTIDILPNGNILVPEYSNGRVTEYTKDGKRVWSANVRYPTSAQRLLNGNTLVTSLTSRTVVELDSKGKTIDTKSVGGMPWHARRR